MSFRPLTGILFFNSSACRSNYWNGDVWFPSPYGDFVFQLNFIADTHSVRYDTFPSPYGDFVFQRGH